MTLVEALGHSPTTKLLIVSCDDLGASHAANLGIYRSLREGWATSAGLMVPGPWAREAASQFRGEDIGVHLTLNADYELFKWSPITYAPSLLGGDGGFPRTVSDLWDHADLDEMRRECKAQVERAIYWGFDVTHVNSHLGALTMRPEFFDVALDIAVEFDLPLRLPNEAAQQAAGFPARRLAQEEGVLSPDFVVSLGRNGTQHAVESAIRDLKPGLTEICLRPAADTPELRALAPDWALQVTQTELLSQNSGLAKLAERAGAVLVDYRSVRDIQRAQRKAHN